MKRILFLIFIMYDTYFSLGPYVLMF